MNEEERGNSVEPIVCSNPREEAAQRYWRASRVWRGLGDDDENWTTGDAIREVRSILFYGFGACPAAVLAERLLEDIVYDRRPNIMELQEFQQVSTTSQSQLNNPNLA